MYKTKGGGGVSYSQINGSSGFVAVDFRGLLFRNLATTFFQRLSRAVFKINFESKWKWLQLVRCVCAHGYINIKQ